MTVGQVLLTGGKGFIGNLLRKRLLEKGKAVIDKYTTNGSRELDITNLCQLHTIEGNVSAIVHLAAKTSIANSLRCPHDTYFTNLTGTLNVLEFARAKKVDNFLNVSSYVYGQPKYLPIDETHPLSPHSPYNKSKVIAEKLCESYSVDYNMDITTLRPFYIYGPNARPGSLIYSVVEQIRKNGKVYLSGEFTKRDFLFVDDFLRLVEIILENFPEGYNVYNVGHGTSHTIKEVAEKIAQIMDKDIIINYRHNIGDTGYQDVTEMECDITKVTRAFNWKPETCLDKGLQLSVENLMGKH
jgi:nucleoside-diphosphate-sugar epimerase